MVSKTEDKNKKNESTKWFISKIPENRRFKFFNRLSNSNKKLKENSIVQENLKLSNEDSRNQFPENIKDEMTESLSRMHEVNLVNVEIDRTLNHDDFWNFINVKINEENQMKCREYQPWISWFAYQEIKKDQYNIWFYEKGEPLDILPFTGDIIVS